MRIEENKIFEFRFPFYGGELSIPIRAQTREEAAEELKKHLDSMMIDLATEFPKHAPQQPERSASSEEKRENHTTTPAPNDSGAGAVPSFALELNIEDLIKHLMPIKKPKGANAIGKLVKEWTGFEYAPENYPAIIEGLEQLKRDAK